MNRPLPKPTVDLDALPAWVSSPEGQELVSAILNDPPEYTITKGGWIEGGGQRRYHGRTVGQLRKLREQHLESLYAQPWERVKSQLSRSAHETADELIARLTDPPELQCKNRGSWM